jgi:hypothetical protein
MVDWEPTFRDYTNNPYFEKQALLGNSSKIECECLDDILVRIL